MEGKQCESTAGWSQTAGWSENAERSNDEVVRSGGFDVVIGNPPYGGATTEIQKTFFKTNYKSTKTIKGTQKGSTDTYTLFLEKAHQLVKINGNVSMIVPMSITSSDSLTALHNLLFKSCSKIKISSFAHRPVQVFPAAGQAVSIIKYKKDNKQTESILATKMQRLKNREELDKLLKKLEFVEVNDLKLYGRIPKISKEIERNILTKLFACENNIGTLKQEKGSPIYYRTSGGQYWKVVTNYSTSSPKERPIYFEKRIANCIGAIMSSNLFFYFHQCITNVLDMKEADISYLGIPILTDEVIAKLEDLYAEYLIDIESNKVDRPHAAQRKQEYKIVYSKGIIHHIDDIICPLYGLTKEETNFIKRYEIEFRRRGER